MKKILIALALSYVSISVFGQPHFSIVWSGNGVDHMNLYVLSASIDEINMQPGDEIGIFDGDACVGVGILESVLSEGVNYLSIIASKDDELTPEHDGYVPGNQISYRLWDNSGQEEINLTELTYTAGTGIFIVGGTIGVHIRGIKTIEGTIPLTSGWNIISLPVIPSDDSMMTTLQPLMDSGILVKMQDEAGNAIENVVPIGWVDNIVYWRLTEGYKLRVTVDGELPYSGAPHHGQTLIDLSEGWNIMSYPYTETQSALDALSELIGNSSLEKVQDEQGNAIENVVPIGLVDNIGDFEPGEGYKIKVNTDDTLTLGEASFKSAFEQSIQSTPVHFMPSWKGNGVDHMNIYVLNYAGLDIGDEIAAFDMNQCVGSAMISNTNQRWLSIAASMDDPTTPEIDGYTEGDAIGIRVWKKTDDAEIETNVVYENGYKSVFEKMGTTVTTVHGQITGEHEVNSVKPDHSSLGEIFPNPFTIETLIPYQLEKGTRVSLSIYDLTGRRIRTLVNNEMASGSYTAIWDGKDENEMSLPSGVYVCQFVAGDVTISKMIEMY